MLPAALHRLWAIVLGDDVPSADRSSRDGGHPPAAGPRDRSRRPTLADVVVLSPGLREELQERARNGGAVVAAVAALIVPAWSLVDRALEPALAGWFLAVRLLADVPVLALVWALVATPLGRRRPELLTWLALAVVQVEVAWMIPQVGHRDYYLMGYTLAVYASGCLLAAPPRWTGALIGLSWGSLAGFQLAHPGPTSPGTLVGTAAYLATASLIAVIAHVRRHVVTLRELTTRTRLEHERERSRVLLDRLERLSNEDPLTGLANRRRWDAALATACGRCRVDGAPVAVLLLDLDHFKLLNDRHGHPGGDEALRCVAGLLSSRVRGEDLVARLGGDELGVLLPGADGARAVALAEQLRRDAALLRPAGFGPGEITLSVGVAVAAGTAAVPQGLMARADEQLYRAKGTRNSVGAPAPRGVPAGG